MFLGCYFLPCVNFLHFTDLISRRVDTVCLQNPELSSLAAQLPKVLIQSKAETTNKKYQRVFKHWFSWAKQHDIVSVPASDSHVALYLISVIQRSNSLSLVLMKCFIR